MIQTIITILLSLVVGMAVGYFITQRLVAKQMKENPPVNEKMIRAMYLQMGRKPSEAQIRQTINAMNKHK